MILFSMVLCASTCRAQDTPNPGVTVQVSLPPLDSINVHDPNFSENWIDISDLNLEEQQARIEKTVANYFGQIKEKPELLLSYAEADKINEEWQRYKNEEEAGEIELQFEKSATYKRWLDQLNTIHQEMVLRKEEKYAALNEIATIDRKREALQDLTTLRQELRDDLHKELLSNLATVSLSSVLIGRLPSTNTPGNQNERLSELMTAAAVEQVKNTYLPNYTSILGDSLVSVFSTAPYGHALIMDSYFTDPDKIVNNELYLYQFLRIEVFPFMRGSTRTRLSDFTEGNISEVYPESNSTMRFFELGNPKRPVIEPITATNFDDKELRFIRTTLDIAQKSTVWAQANVRLIQNQYDGEVAAINARIQEQQDVLTILKQLREAKEQENQQADSTLRSLPGRLAEETRHYLDAKAAYENHVQSRTSYVNRYKEQIGLVRPPSTDTANTIDISTYDFQMMAEHSLEILGALQQGNVGFIIWTEKDTRRQLKTLEASEKFYIPNAEAFQIVCLTYLPENTSKPILLLNLAFKINWRELGLEADPSNKRLTDELKKIDWTMTDLFFKSPRLRGSAPAGAGWEVPSLKELQELAEDVNTYRLREKDLFKDAGWILEDKSFPVFLSNEEPYKDANNRDRYTGYNFSTGQVVELGAADLTYILWRRTLEPR